MNLWMVNEDDGFRETWADLDKTTRVRFSVDSGGVLECELCAGECFRMRGKDAERFRKSLLKEDDFMPEQTGGYPKYCFAASRSGVGFAGKLRTCEATSVDGGKVLLTVRILVSAHTETERLAALLHRASMGAGATIEIQFQAEDVP